MRRRMVQGKKPGIVFLMTIMLVMFLCSPQVPVYAEGCGVIVIYDGKGAGQVVFDGPLHLSKRLTCSDCHEGKAFSFALFEKKRGADIISMRSMALGRSCGYCHDGKSAFSTTDSLNCSKCHQK